METIQGSATAVKDRPARSNRKAPAVAPDPAAAPVAVAGKHLPAPSSATLMSIIERIALDPSFDVTKLKEMLDVKERWEKAEAKKAFDAAMVEFKKSMPQILKNKRVHYESRDSSKPATDYWHATLDNVCDQIIPPLAAVGISHKWIPNQSNGTIKVTCVLTHALGHSESTTLEASYDTSGGKNSIQAIVSAKSYLERHTLTAATGTATKDQDDDGHGAGKRTDGDQQGAQQTTAGRSETNGKAKPPYKDEDLAKYLPEWQAAGTVKRNYDKLKTRYAFSEKQLTFMGIQQ